MHHPGPVCSNPECVCAEPGTVCTEFMDHDDDHYCARCGWQESDHFKGVWEVKTHTAHYLLNFDSGMLLRRPSGSAMPNQFNDDEQFAVAELRKDGGPIPFLLAGELKVGQDMYLLLMLRDDGVPTHRRTTPVLSMEREVFP